MSVYLIVPYVVFIKDEDPVVPSSVGMVMRRVVE